MSYARQKSPSQVGIRIQTVLHHLFCGRSRFSLSAVPATFDDEERQDAVRVPVAGLAGVELLTVLSSALILKKRAVSSPAVSGGTSQSAQKLLTTGGLLSRAVLCISLESGALGDIKRLQIDAGGFWVESH